MTTFLDAALMYAALGWRVFPLAPGQKVPLTAHGVKDATTDESQIRAWWAKWPNANIAVACGAGSGIYVVDVDVSEKVDGFASLKSEFPRLPKTVTQNTPRGGAHAFYRADNPPASKNGFRPGVDIRSDGFYVVVAPSVGPNGQRYKWESGLSPWEYSLANFPDFLHPNKPSLQKPIQPEPKPPLVQDQPTLDVATGDVVWGARRWTLEERRKRAAAYLYKMSPSIQGQNGSDPFYAACVIAVHGFMLPLDVAKRVVLECLPADPPWTDEREIAHKLEDAANKPHDQPLGWLLLSKEDDLPTNAVVAPSGKSIQTDVGDDIETTPLPDPQPRPTLDPAAYHGIVGEIVRLMEPETEADPVAILIQLLVTLGNMIGRTAYFVVEGTLHFPNLFAVLVGQTAKGRKGTSEGRVRQILRAVDESWETNNIQTGLSSGEGLIYHVRNPLYEIQPIKQNGRILGEESVLVDAGVVDKRLCVLESEFGSTLQVNKRESNTLSAVIRSAWDSGNLATLTKNSPLKASDAHISIIGHITKEELWMLLQKVDIYNGFWNRFLWAEIRRSKLLPNGGRNLDLSVYTERLSRIIKAARSVDQMRRDAAAEALWQQAYYRLANDDATGLVAAATGRAEAQVLRLSMLYALLDGTGVIGEPHLRAALALWDYCRQSAQSIFGTLGTTLEQRVLAAIRKKPGIGRREIYKALNNHVKGTVLAAALAALRDADKIRVETVPRPGGGRAAERWYPCEPCEHCEPTRSAKRPWEIDSQSSQEMSEYSGPNMAAMPENTPANG